MTGNLPGEVGVNTLERRMVPSRMRAGTSWRDVYEHFADVDSAALAAPVPAPVTNRGMAIAIVASSPTAARRRLTKALVTRMSFLSFLHRPGMAGTQAGRPPSGATVLRGFRLPDSRSPTVGALASCPHGRPGLHNRGHRLSRSYASVMGTLVSTGRRGKIL